MIDELDREIENFVKEKRGHEFSENEREAFDQFIESWESLVLLLKVKKDPLAERLREKLISYFSKAEKEHILVSELTAVALFVCNVVASSDRKFSEELLERLVTMF